MVEILDTDDLASRIGGKKAIKHKSYWMVCCPAHDDRSPSLKIYAGEKTVLFHCYAGCDSLDVMKSIYNNFSVIPWNRSQTERDEKRQYSRPSPPAKTAPAKPEPIWAGPVVDGAPTPGQTPYPSGSVETARWAWRDADGKIVYWNIRADHADGGKTFIPMSMWNGQDGVPRWTNCAPPSHPLYDLHRDNGSSPIIYLEGEKTADAAKTVFGSSYWCTTAGSSNSISRCDIAPLAGRDIIIVPDLDSSGFSHVQAIATQAGAARIRLLIPPPSVVAKCVKGDDLADFIDIIPPAQLLSEIRENPRDWLHSLSL